MLPYELASDGINVRDAIELCQKAYANIPIFRNTVDMMSEFANAELYLEGGNKNLATSLKNFSRELKFGISRISILENIIEATISSCIEWMVNSILMIIRNLPKIFLMDLL